VCVCVREREREREGERLFGAILEVASSASLPLLHRRRHPLLLLLLLLLLLPPPRAWGVSCDIEKSVGRVYISVSQLILCVC